MTNGGGLAGDMAAILKVQLDMLPQITDSASVTESTPTEVLSFLKFEDRAGLEFEDRAGLEWEDRG